MSIAVIYPSKVAGSIKAPSSKSYSQRVAIAALLKGGESIITNYGNSNDETAALKVIQQLGCSILFENNKLIIQSSFDNNNTYSNNLSVGESGLLLRLITPVASLLNYQIKINGKGSLLTRPIDLFENVLPKLDVEVQSKNNQLPLFVCGSMKMKNIAINGEISSQFLTGFLFAYSFLFAQNYNCDEIKITVTNLNSKPYVDLTIDVLEKFGLPIPVNRDYKEFIFQKNSTKKSEIVEYNIEGDWSNAAFLLVAGAINNGVTVNNLNKNSAQADMKILDVLSDIGCKIEFTKNSVSVKKNEPLLAFDFDATDCPDLFPPLVALAANCKGISTIKGVNRLKHKESNRAIVLQKEFGKLGVEILLENDIMKIIETSIINGGTVKSNNDHRIAMACAIAALNAKDKVTIEDAEAVNKSYPNFFEDLKCLGVKIE